MFRKFNIFVETHCMRLLHACVIQLMVYREETHAMRLYQDNTLWV